MNASLSAIARVTYPARAAGLLGLWLVGTAPALTGLMRCPSAALFHHACPGCGMTRAMWLFARGDLRASLMMNPVAVPTSLAILGVVVALVWVMFRDGTLAAAGGSKLVRIAIALLAASQVAALVVWIARSFGALGGLPPV